MIKWCCCAQLGFSAEARELEAWLMRCHERATRERSRPSRADAVWQREFDRIEEVRTPSWESRL